MDETILKPFRTKMGLDIFNHKYAHANCETWEKLAHVLVEDVCRGEIRPDRRRVIEKYIAEMKFIPGGRYLYYAGRENKFFNNCFILKSEEDTREDWAMTSWKHEMCLMTGGGTGNDYSIYRPAGTPIKRTGGKASGSIPKMKMINEIGRNVMQGGARRCLPYNSAIHTKEGLKEIRNIHKGDLVLTYNGYKKVLASINQGEQNTIILNTQLGSFECTPNHKLSILDGHNKYKWKRAEEISEDDRILFIPKEIRGEEMSLPEFIYDKPPKSTRCQDIVIPQLDTDIAYLFGLIAGDGYVYINKTDKKTPNSPIARRGKVSIACSLEYPNIIKRAKIGFKKFGLNPKINNGDGALVNVTVYAYQLALYLSEWKTPNNEIIIPEYITNNTRDIRSAYLAGLLDSDGCVKTRPIQLVTSVYSKFIEGVQRLYHSLGIPVRLKGIDRKEENWKRIYSLGLVGKTSHELFYNSVEKYSVKKGDRQSKHGQFDYTIPSRFLPTDFKGSVDRAVERVFEHTGEELNFIPIKVVSISSGNLIETYDIEVEDRNEFVCEGYLVHNSALFASLNWRHGDINEFLHCKDWYNMPVSGAYNDDGTNITIGTLKEKDFNYPAPLDMTNISLNYDNKFLETLYDMPIHEVAKSVSNGTSLPFKYIPATFYENVRQALKTGEPGFSFNFFDKEDETGRNACCEITSADDSDVCNLGSINMSRIENIEDFGDIVQAASEFLLCGTLKAKLPYDKIKTVREKNRRLGLGLMGVHEWLITRGYRYEVVEELHEWLRVYEAASEIGANDLADKLKINRPVAYRAIAPTGTISILTGTSTGIEPLYTVAYKRRYLKGEHQWHYQYVVDGTAKTLIENGVDPNSIESAIDLANDVERRIKFQADVQDYVDMAISSTINVPQWGTELNNETRIYKFTKTLLSYAHRLRGFTCYPDGARGGQPITAVSYEEALKHEGEEFKENFHDVCELTGSGTCGV